MKLSGADATRYFAKPDPKRTGLLIFGQDAMRVALRRQEVIAALIGPEGEAEMRLTRIPAADLRKDPAVLLDAMKSQGFFPGPRVAFLEDATDTAAPLVAIAMKDWRPGDATILVTAGGLTGKSALKKLFDDRSWRGLMQLRWAAMPTRWVWRSRLLMTFWTLKATLR